MIHRYILVAIPFSVGLLTNAVDVALPLWIRDTNASPFVAGTLGSVGGVVYIGVALLIGCVSGRVNRKAILITALVLQSVVMAVMPLASSAIWLGAAILLQGASMAMFWPIWQISLRQLTQGSLTAAVGGFSVAIGIGAVGGALAGGAVYEIDARLPFVLAAMISLGTGAWLLRFPTLEDTSTPEHVTAQQSPTGAGGATSPRMKRFLWIVWLANFGMHFCMCALTWLFPFLARDLAISETSFGVMVAVLRGLPIVLHLIMGRTEAWHDRIGPLLAAQALAIAGLACMLLFSSTVLLVAAFALVGIGVGTTYFYALYYSIHASPAGGTRTGTNEAITVGGATCGSFFGGLVADQFTIRSPNLLCIGLVVGLMTVQCFIRRK